MDTAISKSPALLMKMPEPSIDPEAIWKDDKLAREGISNRLTEFVSTINQPFVISLQAPYGSGKTFFLTRWRETLLKQGYSAIIFDAWKNDFSKDPLIAFISAIRTQLPEIQGVSSEAIKGKVGRLSKKIAGIFARKAVPILAKAAVDKLVGESAAKDILKELELGDISESILEEALKGQEEAEKSIEAFRLELESLAESLSENADDSKKKLIILVDELDRCRPDYAISLLECIKHFFSAKGVVFILALDERQLKSSIRAVYGDIDVDGYLARFIDLRFKLPAPTSRNFLIAQWNIFRLQEVPHIDGNSFTDTFTDFARAYGLSLREQAQLYTLINLAIRISRTGLCAWLFPVVAILRMKEGEKVFASGNSKGNRVEFIRSVLRKFDVPLHREHLLNRREILFEAILADEKRASDLTVSGDEKDIKIIELYRDIARAVPGDGSVFQRVSKILDAAEQLLAP